MSEITGKNVRKIKKKISFDVKKSVVYRDGWFEFPGVGVSLVRDRRVCVVGVIRVWFEGPFGIRVLFDGVGYDKKSVCVGLVWSGFRLFEKLVAV